ncbi:hypothetical protein L596_001105 [Steinernema carpocapsae]|uniref:Uncharacterized protein n=1 Tax=Steinernema carpocapsae TaxID=34508 RepID=A0A4U8UJZ8_STECR|nr:hypothetical protein L596_001105 [Steinernema carpocapsae]
MFSKLGLIVLVTMVLCVTLVQSQSNHFLPVHSFFMPQPFRRPNVAVGSPLARIFLLCNGINCPARG